jgi:hypothetical protein
MLTVVVVLGVEPPPDGLGAVPPLEPPHALAMAAITSPKRKSFLIDGAPGA